MAVSTPGCSRRWTPQYCVSWFGKSQVRSYLWAVARTSESTKIDPSHLFSQFTDREILTPGRFRSWMSDHSVYCRNGSQVRECLTGIMLRSDLIKCACTFLLSPESTRCHFIPLVFCTIFGVYLTFSRVCLITLLVFVSSNLLNNHAYTHLHLSCLPFAVHT